MIELARVDGSMSTFLMVHNSLTMLTIGLLGSEAQKAELLPPMARLDWVGALLSATTDHNTCAGTLYKGYFICTTAQLTPSDSCANANGQMEKIRRYTYHMLTPHSQRLAVSILITSPDRVKSCLFPCRPPGVLRCAAGVSTAVLSVPITGAWGLTEPSNGSDASALETTATKVRNHCSGGY